MNNFPDAMISISLDRQAEKVRQVQAVDIQRPQPVAGRIAVLLTVASVAGALLLAFAAH